MATYLRVVRVHIPLGSAYFSADTTPYYSIFTFTILCFFFKQDFSGSYGEDALKKTNQPVRFYPMFSISPVTTT